MNASNAARARAAKARRPWAKMLSPEHVQAVMHEYDAGVNTAVLCKKYEVSRAWLFRTRKRYVQGLDPGESTTYLQAEIARLKEVIVHMAKCKFTVESDTMPQDVQP